LVRRLKARLEQSIARSAGLALCLFFSGPLTAGAEIVGAQFADPTLRYPHGALGDDVEHETLRVQFANGRSAAATWPDTVVFEDTDPRLVDLDGDGAPEVIVVESHESQGARLAIYGEVAGQLQLRAATPFIGTRFRWLAPLGAADLDGDGTMEIAYVDRPHLARTLRVLRYETQGGTARLVPVATFDSVTNHQNGDTTIFGGFRDCDLGPEMVLATPDWSRLRGVRLENGHLTGRDLGAGATPQGFAAALVCQ
jgi:hypothetical protein